MKTQPLISILMPTYNMATLLLESIPSILKQDYQNFELIIIDDGSTDQTKEIIEAFSDKRIVYLYREHNYIASLNAGINISRGKYIMRMDADDIMMEGRITLQTDFMETYPEIDICGGGTRNFGWAEGDIYPLKDHNSIIASLLLYNTIAHPTVILRKSSIEVYINKYGSLYDEKYIYAEDYRLWTCLAIEGYRFSNLHKILVKHRISKQAVTVVFAEQSKQLADDIRKQYLKFAINKIISKDNKYTYLIDEIISLSAKQLLSLHDLQQLVYVLYKKILK